MCSDVVGDCGLRLCGELLARESFLYWHATRLILARASAAKNALVLLFVLFSGNVKWVRPLSPREGGVGEFDHL